ncbi:unnamed protein product, partial [Staurois parvus]
IIHRHLVITKDLRWGGGLLCLLTVLLPVGLGTLLWMAVHSHPEQCAYSEAPTHRPQ